MLRQISYFQVWGKGSCALKKTIIATVAALPQFLLKLMAIAKLGNALFLIFIVNIVLENFI